MEHSSFQRHQRPLGGGAKQNWPDCRLQTIDDSVRRNRLQPLTVLLMVISSESGNPSFKSTFTVSLNPAKTVQLINATMRSTQIIATKRRLLHPTSRHCTARKVEPIVSSLPNQIVDERWQLSRLHIQNDQTSLPHGQIDKVLARRLGIKIELRKGGLVRQLDQLQEHL